MRKVNFIRLFLIVTMSISFFMGGVGCEKKEAPPVANKPLPENGYKAEIIVKDPPASLKASSTTVIKTIVKNISEVTWPAPGQYSVRLSYHWLSSEGKMIVDSGLRTDFANPIMPNKEIEADAKVAAPDKPGNYILEFDMVQEEVAWFKEKGSKTTQLKVKVE